MKCSKKQKEAKKNKKALGQAYLKDNEIVFWEWKTAVEIRDSVV